MPQNHTTGKYYSTKAASKLLKMGTIQKFGNDINIPELNCQKIKTGLNSRNACHAVQISMSFCL